MSSLSRSETPGNVAIAVPGTITAGSAIQGPKSPSVHSKVAVLRKALVYLNPCAVPARRPMIPNRLGPRRLSPPFSMVWQIALLAHEGGFSLGNVRRLACARAGAEEDRNRGDETNLQAHLIPPAAVSW